VVPFFLFSFSALCSLLYLSVLSVVPLFPTSVLSVVPFFGFGALIRLASPSAPV